MAFTTRGYRTPIDQPEHLEGLHWFGHAVPIVLCIVGFFIPVMQYRVFDLMSLTTQEVAVLGIAMAIEITFAAIWVVTDLAIITSDKTAGRQIKRNIAISTTINNFMVFLLGGLALSDRLPWWIIVPAIAQIVDDYVVSIRGVSNALQKPIAQANP